MKTVVITGTDRGLGLALAEQLLAEGNRVFATARNPDCASLLALASRHEEHVDLVELDIGDARSVASSSALIHARTAAVDVLINNAGILGDIERTVGDADLDFDDMLEVIRVNAIGPLRVTHALWERLAAGADKLLVNISSEAGSIGQNWRDRWFGYCMSKAALNMEGALVHQRLRPIGGRVMQVPPGYVRTSMHGARNEKATYEPAAAAGLVLAAVRRQLAEPVGERPDYFDLHGKSLP